MKNNFSFKLKLIIEFLLIYIVYLILSKLPFFLVSNLGGLIFKLIGPKTKIQNIVKKNLLQIFPNTELNFLCKESQKNWFKIGKTFFELLILPKIINTKNRILIEGKENIKNIVENSEKVIFIGIHQSNWEILLPTIDKMGIPVAGIYRHFNNPYINNLILKIRKKCIYSKKSFYTPKGKKSAKAIIEGIKNDTSIVLLIDQKDSAGEEVPFFDFPAKTQTGFIKISKKYNLKIVPVQNIRNNNDTFTLKFHKPINQISNEISDINAMKNIHSIIEEWIKTNPSDWFLQHNRFS
jgi:KDO2-lipid IV(A) lauroyltransferase